MPLDIVEGEQRVDTDTLLAKASISLPRSRVPVMRQSRMGMRVAMVMLVPMALTAIETEKGLKLRP